MATKTKNNNVPAYLKKTVDKYGDIIKSGNKVLEEKSDYKVISISPALDIGLGGGIREGCWLTLTGDPKSGKTTTAMQIAANCLAEGRKVIYIDAEGRLKDLNFQVAGLTPDDMVVIAPVNKPLSAEVLLETAYKLLCDPEYHGAVLIIDSIFVVVPRTVKSPLTTKCVALTLTFPVVAFKFISPAFNVVTSIPTLLSVSVLFTIIEGLITPVSSTSALFISK